MQVYDRLDRQYQMFADEYKAAAIKVLESAWYILGDEVSQFETSFAAFVGTKHAMGLNSGLDALILALQALGIGEGDEVLVPANTFIATIHGITANRAAPVLIEPDEYFNMDTDRIEAAITPKTKAILPVHLFGQACNMQKIKALCDQYGLFLIEDCAQAHGASLNGKSIGTWGDIACFSFYPTKNLGAFGDAGAIVTDREDLAEKVRMLRNYGSRIKYHNEVLGVNSRLDEIQAALLSVKLKHYPELFSQKQTYAKHYLAGIQNPLVKLPTVRDGATSAWHQFVICCEQRNDLAEYLKANGIATIIHYPIPPHLQACYRYLGIAEGSLPITEHLARTSLSIPMFNGILDEEQQFVMNTINSYGQ